MNSQRDNAACLEALQAFVDQSLSRHILDGVVSMKAQADQIREENSVEQLDSNAVMMQLLKEVRQWTQTLLDEEVRRIEALVPFLNKLLTALFIMKVKVLSCLNMRHNTEDFPLTVPSNHTFIHQVYIHVAQSLMDNIEMVEKMNMSNMRETLSDSLRKAEYQCLQWGDLLEWGLGNMETGKLLSMIDEQSPLPVNSTPESAFKDDPESSPMPASTDETDYGGALDSMANDSKAADSIGTMDDGEEGESNMKDHEASPVASEDNDDARTQASDSSNEEEETRTVGEKDEDDGRPRASFW